MGYIISTDILIDRSATVGDMINIKLSTFISPGSFPNAGLVDLVAEAKPPPALSIRN